MTSDAVRKFDGQITSVTELWRFLDKLPRHNTRIYRGQDIDEPLLPKYWREAKRSRLPQPLQAEQRLVDLFRRLSPPYLHQLPHDTFEWLALAQHHGLPTRLLDWTGNPLFALWFAVRNGPAAEAKKNGSLWVLDVQDEHYIPGTEKGKDVYQLHRTRVFRPPHITERIVAQDGWFTVHWYIEKQDKFVPLEKQKRFNRHLAFATIPRRSFEALQTELRRLGISDRVLFPDLVTLCKELTAEHFPR